MEGGNGPWESADEKGEVRPGKNILFSLYFVMFFVFWFWF